MTPMRDALPWMLAASLGLAACGPKGPVEDVSLAADDEWFKDPADEPPPPPPEVPTICGEVRMTAEIASAQPTEGTWYVFIVATRGPNDPRILAGVKMKLAKFPMKFCLSEKNLVQRGVPFAGNLFLNARVDGDGLPGIEPGDFDGTTRAAIPVGTKTALVVIDTFR